MTVRTPERPEANNNNDDGPFYMDPYKAKKDYKGAQYLGTKNPVSASHMSGPIVDRFPGLVEDTGNSSEPPVEKI